MVRSPGAQRPGEVEPETGGRAERGWGIGDLAVIAIATQPASAQIKPTMTKAGGRLPRIGGRAALKIPFLANLVRSRTRPGPRNVSTSDQRRVLVAGTVPAA